MPSRRERIAAVMHTTRLEHLFRARPLWNGLVVLNYHRIGDPATTLFDRGVFSGTPDDLARQIRLVRQYAEIVAPTDVPDLLTRPSRWGRHVLFTFDDGYRDNYELAFPVLQSEGVRAAFFLNSGFMDSPRLTWNDELSWMVRSSSRMWLDAPAWISEPLDLDAATIDATVGQVQALYPTLNEDPVRTAAYLDDIATVTGSGRAPRHLADNLWMTWDMAREMHAAGMELGGHTVDHPSLGQVPEERQQGEIAGVRDRIVAEIGQAPVSFAYPYGGQHQFTEATKRLLAESGYTHGYSFYGGFNVPGNTDLYDIRRVYMVQETTDNALAGLVTFPHLYGLVPPKLPWKR